MHRAILWFSFLAFVPAAMPAQGAAPADSVRTAAERLRQLPPLAMDEVLWLARCLISEADRPNEQALVAWVVRNRVETGYRGANYREVILERLQFSAFNEPSPRRDAILAYNQNTTDGAWQQALRIALDVYRAPATERPFAVTTRHFYSPVSMPGHAAPAWAHGMEPVDVSRYGIDPFRFKFYDSVNEEYATKEAPATPPARLASERVAKQKERIRRVEAPQRTRSLRGMVSRPARPKSMRR